LGAEPLSPQAQAAAAAVLDTQVATLTAIFAAALVDSTTDEQVKPCPFASITATKANTSSLFQGVAVHIALLGNLRASPYKACCFVSVKAARIVHNVLGKFAQQHEAMESLLCCC
jgi:hypothetical protein